MKASRKHPFKLRMVGYVNESIDDESSLDLPPDWVLIPLVAVKLLVLGVCFIGNLIIFLVVCSSWKLRCRSMYIFIASLSLNNLIFASTGGLIHAMERALNEPILDLGICHVGPFLYAIFYCMSIWHTAAIAVHRLVVIVYRKYYERVPRLAYILLVLTASRLFPLTFIFDAQSGTIAKTVLVNGGVICRFHSGFSLIFNCILNIIAPTTIIIASYAQIYVFLKRSRLETAVLQKTKRSELKALRIFGMVSLTFLIGYLPLTILMVVVTFTEMSQIWYISIGIVAEMGIASHPFVYGFMDADIHRTLVRSFCCRQTADEVSTPALASAIIVGPQNRRENRLTEEHASASDHFPNPSPPGASVTISRLPNMSLTDGQKSFTAEDTLRASHSPQNKSKQLKTVPLDT